MSAISIMKAAGAAKVLAFDLMGDRLALAKKMGADSVLHKVKYAVPKNTLMQLTISGGYIDVESVGDVVRF